MKKERTRNLLPAYVGIYGIIIFLVNTIATNLAFIRTMVYLILLCFYKSYSTAPYRTWTALSARCWWRSPPTSTSACTAPPSSSTPAQWSAETAACCSASGPNTVKVSNKISREYVQTNNNQTANNQHLVERPCLQRFSAYCVRRNFVDTFILNNRTYNKIHNNVRSASSATVTPIKPASVSGPLVSGFTDKQKT